MSVAGGESRKTFTQFSKRENVNRKHSPSLSLSRGFEANPTRNHGHSKNNTNCGQKTHCTSTKSSATVLLRDNISESTVPGSFSFEFEIISFELEIESLDCNPSFRFPLGSNQVQQSPSDAFTFMLRRSDKFTNLFVYSLHVDDRVLPVVFLYCYSTS